MTFLKCPHCGKFQELVSGSLARDIENDLAFLQQINPRTCKKCGKKFTVKVSGSSVYAVK